jgi:hypothetical protein
MVKDEAPVDLADALQKVRDYYRKEDNEWVIAEYRMDVRDENPDEILESYSRVGFTKAHYIQIAVEELQRRVEAGSLPTPLHDDIAILLMEVAANE